MLESNRDSCLTTPASKPKTTTTPPSTTSAEGDHQRALEEYRKSIAADPTFTEALHGMARTLQDLDRLDEAIEVANRIAELDPDDILAHTSLSVLYQKKGMVPEAEAEANKARVLGWKQQLKKGSS